MDDRLEDLFPFYALGALSAEERAAVDAYVARDSDARARLDEALRAAAVMAYSATPVDPAPRIRRALMDRVDADARSRQAARRRQLDPPRLFNTRLFKFGMPAIAAVSLIIASVLGLWTASLNAELARLKQETALLQQQLSAEREVLAQISSPQAQAMSIAGTQVQPQAHGQMIADPHKNMAVLIVANLSALPPGKVYQFWLIRGKVPISAGIFTVDEQGRGLLAVQAADAIGSFDAIGVSIEPDGGSPQPTGDIVMLSNLSSS
jgi:anti-sigma-K factor RskA